MAYTSQILGQDSAQHNTTMSTITYRLQQSFFDQHLLIIEGQNKCSTGLERSV